LTEFECPNCGTTLIISTAEKGPVKAPKTLDRIKTLFPTDLREMLSFTESGEYHIIKPLNYLGSDTFAKIASIIREAGGEYVSAGKESHFRVPA